MMNKLDLKGLNTANKVLVVCTLCCLANSEFLTNLLSDKPRPKYLADKQSFLKDLQIILLNDKTIIKYYKDEIAKPEDQNMFDDFFDPLDEFDIIKGRKILQKAQDLANIIRKNIMNIKEVGIYKTSPELSLIVKDEISIHDVSLQSYKNYVKNVDLNSLYDAIFGEGNNLNQSKYKSKMDHAINELFQFMKTKVDPNILKHLKSFVLQETINMELLNNATLLDPHKKILGLFIPEFNMNVRKFKDYFEQCLKTINEDPEFIALYNKLVVRDIFVDSLIDYSRMFKGDIKAINGIADISGLLKNNFDLAIKDLLDLWAGSKLYAIDDVIISSETSASLDFYLLETPYILKIACQGYNVCLEYGFNDGLISGKPVIKITID